VCTRGIRHRIEGKTCGIQHLAKNERDVGHPALVPGIDKALAFKDGRLLARELPRIAPEENLVRDAQWQRLKPRSFLGFNGPTKVVL
jgi:hypothetical protein